MKKTLALGSCFLHFPRVNGAESNCGIAEVFGILLKNSYEFQLLFLVEAKFIYSLSPSNRVLSQCNTRLRLLYLLKKRNLEFQFFHDRNLSNYPHCLFSFFFLINSFYCASFDTPLHW